MEYNHKKHVRVPVLVADREDNVRSRVSTRQSTRLSATYKSTNVTSRQRNASSTKIADKKGRQPEVEELYKLSYPCHTNDCCYCAYTKCLGPVKIFITQYTRSNKRWNKTPAIPKNENKMSENESKIKRPMGKQFLKPETVRKPPDTRTTNKPRKAISWK